MEKVVNILNSRVVLREGSEKDKEDILNFLNFLFPHKFYDFKWFDWVRRENEYKRDYYLAYEGKKLAAIYGLSPVKVKHKDKIFWASQCCNIGLDPSYWGSDLFEKISIFALERDKEKGRFFSFCSPRRPLAVKAHKRIGWLHTKDLVFLEKNNKGLHLKHGFEKVDFFKEEHNNILLKFFEGRDFCILKDHSYLNWRYESNAYSFYTNYKDSIFVVKEYVDKEKNIKYFHIIENFTNSFEELKNVFNFLSFVKKEDFKMNTWAIEGSKDFEILKNHSFQNQGQKCPFLIYPYYDEVKGIFSNLENPYFSLGDDEAF